MKKSKVGLHILRILKDRPNNIATFSLLKFFVLFFFCYLFFSFLLFLFCFFCFQSVHMDDHAFSSHKILYEKVVANDADNVVN